MSDATTKADAGPERQVQIKFFTRQRKYVLPDVAIMVPTNLRRFGLSEVVNHLVQPDGRVAFDFLLDGKLLRSSVQEYLDAQQLSTENTLAVEVIESIVPPRPLASYEHDDWVASVHASQSGKQFLSGGYDGMVRVWNQSGQCTGVMQGHSQPVKAVKFISADRCVSGSQDRTVRWWKRVGHNHETFSEWAVEFEGRMQHTSSVESIAVAKDAQLTLSGDYAGSIRVWHADDAADATDHHTSLAGTGPVKKRKVQAAVRQLTSRSSLDGHVGSVSGLVFGGSAEVAYSSGLDHTVRQWQVETGSTVTSMSCDHSALCIDHSPLNKLIATGHSDRMVRLWDPRVVDGSVMKAKLASHTGWVTAVSWCPDNAFHLCTASHDGRVKVWDVRSSTPLYTITHKTKGTASSNKPEHGKLFSCHWAQGGNVILSGGEDSCLYLNSYDSTPSPTGEADAPGK